MKTKGALLYEAGEDAQYVIEEIEMGEPRQGEVMIKVTASGLCHSDEHVRVGEFPTEHLPILCGHEGSGVVHKVGPGVTRFQEGDHIVMTMIGCGHCGPCRQGNANLCDLSAANLVGNQPSDGTYRVETMDGRSVGQFCLLGTFAPYTTVNQDCVVKIDERMPLKEAALLGCGAVAGWFGASRGAKIQQGDTVIVAGIGGLGASAILSALNAGAARVIAIDPLENKRAIALELGASHAFASFEEALEPVNEITWGLMAQRVVLTPGTMKASYLGPALELTAKLGTLAVIGMGDFADDDATVNPAWMTAMQKEVVAPLLGGATPQEDVLALVRLYLEGKLPLERLITSEYRLEDVNQGYQDMRDGKNIRGMIVYDDVDY